MNIVCTIGPSSSVVPVLKEMILAGMNVARVNFSHGDQDSNLELIHKVREASEQVGVPVAILQDLQRARLRIGVLPEEGLELVEGKLVKLLAGVVSADKGVIPVPYERFAHDLGKSDRILLADGMRELEVVDVQGATVIAKVLLGGNLISHKSISVPTRTLSMESMTEQDDLDIAFGLKHDIDFVALPFVRSAQDVLQMQEKIKKYLPGGMEPPQIIAKIEKYEALENFDEILEEADGVMIAKGDLGLETPVAKVSVRQKELVARCIAAGKPVIVTDAAIDHADAVMLSGESVDGKYPVQAVRMVADSIEQAEQFNLDDMPLVVGGKEGSVPSAVAASAVSLARTIEAEAIVVTTGSGYSARQVSHLRCEIPIFAATESKRVFNQLLLVWGVHPLLIDGYHTPEQMVEKSLALLKSKEEISHGGKVVIMSGLKKDESTGYDCVIRVKE